MTMAGIAMPAMSEIPTGAPINVPNCHRIFFFRLHGFLPQNVQPEGLQRKHAKVNADITNTATVTRGLDKNNNHLFNKIDLSDRRPQGTDLLDRTKDKGSWALWVW